MDVKFRKLIELGAGEFEHVQPAMIEHLERTRCILKSWSAPEFLQDAGLYYLAYDPKQALITSTERTDIAAIIGEDVEQLIYQYFCCDKDQFYSVLDKGESSVYCHKFTQQNTFVGTQRVKDICELDVAIMVDKATSSPAYLRHNTQVWSNRLNTIESFLSRAANRKIRQLFN
ncbi:hypothetical protein RS130_17620 [Paraglaciecola aquimarina]|uniref:DUF6817 domain-containing protein n=1 Tax=Paraglaciecola aquimarina TaxID=1235557 RepID=A0ABU3SZN4_9ALTE|nr:hypothetical protein [Paraglaciecola aquimarina]MDU0355477.1 hypothetical protein [Paraglaciecola aquimarina]